MHTDSTAVSRENLTIVVPIIQHVVYYTEMYTESTTGSRESTSVVPIVHQVVELRHVHRESNR